MYLSFLAEVLTHHWVQLVVFYHWMVSSAQYSTKLLKQHSRDFFFFSNWKTLICARENFHICESVDSETACPVSELASERRIVTEHFSSDWSLAVTLHFYPANFCSTGAQVEPVLGQSSSLTGYVVTEVDMWNAWISSPASCPRTHWISVTRCRSLVSMNKSPHCAQLNIWMRKPETSLLLENTHITRPQQRWDCSEGSIDELFLCTVWHVTSASHPTHCRIISLSPEMSCAPKTNCRDESP